MRVSPDDLKGVASRIRLLLTDCDGVLTDAGVYYGAEGEALKRFCIRDGMGVKLLRDAGIETGIVTGERSPCVAKRAEKLQISELHLGISDKATLVRELSLRRGIALSEIAFIGDDVNDFHVLQTVGLSACPGDAVSKVQSVVHIILRTPGGQGAFREFAEFILSAQAELAVAETASQFSLSL